MPLPAAVRWPCLVAVADPPRRRPLLFRLDYADSYSREALNAYMKASRAAGQQQQQQQQQQASAAPDVTRSSEPGIGSPWLQMHDSNTNKHYYYNNRTGETSWTKPGTEVPVAPAHPKSPLDERW